MQRLRIDDKMRDLAVSARIPAHTDGTSRWASTFASEPTATGVAPCLRKVVHAGIVRLSRLRSLRREYWLPQWQESGRLRELVRAVQLRESRVPGLRNCVLR